MRSPALVLLPLLLSCGEEPQGNGTPKDSGDTGSLDTAIVGPTDTQPPLWLVTGQEGLIIAYDKARGAGADASYAMGAMFADQLQGVATSAWCQAGGPCLSEIPATGSEADAVAEPLDPMGSAWTWNGHELVVGQSLLPFSYDTATGLAWYNLVLPSSQDASPLAVSFDGLWGAYQGAITLPDPLVLTEPDPAASLPLDEPIRFRWTPTGEDDVFLRVQATGLHRVWHLDDDGEFDLDPSSLGVALGTEARVSIGRWSVEQVDVNGNDLTLMGVWEQPYAPLICDEEDYPVGNIASSPQPGQPIIHPASVAVGFQVLLDGQEVRDFEFDLYGDGTEELLSSALVFEFFDDAGAPLCSILYDASPAVHVGQPAAQGTGVIWDAWELNLANGNSNCRAIDPAIWGVQDLRAIVQSLDWGFGIGTVADTEDALSDVYDWAQTEPVMAGAYIKYGDDWIEVGGAQSYGMETCGVIEPTLTALPKPVGSPLPTRLYLASPVVRFDL